MSFSMAQSFVGGLCIGVGVAIALVVDGKIAGFSGIIGPLTRSLVLGGRKSWNAAFLLGCVLGGLANLPLNEELAFPAPPSRHWAVWLLAAALVGAGTRMGTGCTSGHGLCGLARFSPRSLAAVCTFMSVGMATATAWGAMAAQPDLHVAPLAWPSEAQWAFSLGCLSASALLALAARALPALCPLAAGCSMGLGLGCSGMSSQAKVISFLNFAGRWDPSLGFVMAGGLCVTLPAFHWARRRAEQGPLREGAAFEQPPKKTRPDAQLIAGSALFGAGWGLVGICPGPAVAGLVPNVVLGWPGEDGMLFLLFVPAFCACWLLTDRALTKCSKVALQSGPCAEAADKVEAGLAGAAAAGASGSLDGSSPPGAGPLPKVDVNTDTCPLPNEHTDVCPQPAVHAAHFV